MAEEAKKFGALGGKTRAANLTKGQLSDSARRAALARWGKSEVEVQTTPKAVYGSPDKPLRIAGVDIPCYVLDDGRRVLAQRGLKSAIGMSASGGTSGAQRVARFVESLAAKNFDIKDLAVRINNPILFQTPLGGKVTYGYDAEMLPDLCDVIWEAAQKGALQEQQKHIGVRAQALARALAKTGIVALIDEATGYREVRDRRGLESILNRFLSKELAAWAKRFPDEFYDELFRLRNWQWERKGSQRPVQVAKDTINLVYMRMLPDLLKELEARNPKDVRGRRRAKHHQFCSVDLGSPALNSHVHAIITLMKAFDTWDEFKARVDRSLPVITRLADLPLFNQDEATGEQPNAPTSPRTKAS